MHIGVSMCSPPTRHCSAKLQEASADESSVDRCRGSINIQELLAISLGGRKQETDTTSAEVVQAAPALAGCSEMKLI